MELVKSRFNVKCEMGLCKNQAEYSVKLKRLGIRSELHLCGDCLSELYAEIGKILIPKSPKNAFGSSNDGVITEPPKENETVRIKKVFNKQGERLR